MQGITSPPPCTHTIDGSGDNPINIEGLSDYKVQEQEEGLYEMDTDSDDSDVDSDSD